MSIHLEPGSTLKVKDRRSGEERTIVVHKGLKEGGWVAKQNPHRGWVWVVQVYMDGKQYPKSLGIYDNEEEKIKKAANAFYASLLRSTKEGQPKVGGHGARELLASRIEEFLERKYDFRPRKKDEKLGKTVFYKKGTVSFNTYREAKDFLQLFYGPYLDKSLKSLTKPLIMDRWDNVKKGLGIRRVQKLATAFLKYLRWEAEEQQTIHPSVIPEREALGIPENAKYIMERKQKLSGEQWSEAHFKKVITACEAEAEHTAPLDREIYMVLKYMGLSEADVFWVKASDFAEPDELNKFFHMKRHRIKSGGMTYQPCPGTTEEIIRKRIAYVKARTTELKASKKAGKALEPWEERELKEQRLFYQPVRGRTPGILLSNNLQHEKANESDKRPPHTRWVSKFGERSKKLQMSLGLEPKLPKALRSWYAIYLRKKGVPESHIKIYMGHSEKSQQVNLFYFDLPTDPIVLPSDL